VFWAVCFGWWLAALYFMYGALLLLMPWCRAYSRRCMSLGRFIVWPFQQRVRCTPPRRKAPQVASAASLFASALSHASFAPAAMSHSSPPDNPDSHSINMTLPLLQTRDDSRLAAASPPFDTTSRLVFGQRTRSNPAGHKFSSAVFTVLVCPVLVAAHAVVALACWTLVALLPMAHLNMSLAAAVFSQPLLLKVESAQEQDSDPTAAVNIVRNSHVTSAGGARFLFAKTLGIPNLVLNSLAVVAAVAAVPFVIPAATLLTPAGAVLYLSAACLTVPPLGYFLCVAITSIAAKTSFAFGAVLNASFGSIIEIILYIGAMNHADTGPELVAKGIVGAILTALLLIPGLSMIVGGIKHEEQKFNRVSAGVSSMLLLVSLLGALLPTMFQRLFGRYEIQCTHCDTNITSLANASSTKHKDLISKIEPFSCHKCFMDLTPMEQDDVYVGTTWPLCIMIAIILPALYVTGLFFTLKTHKHRIDQEEADIEQNTHDQDAAAESPELPGAQDPMNWPVGFSVLVLMICTATFAIISENLNNVRPVFCGVSRRCVQSRYGCAGAGLGRSRHWHISLFCWYDYHRLDAIGDGDRERYGICLPQQHSPRN
jgi:Ca2+:H+ antiporter